MEPRADMKEVATQVVQVVEDSEVAEVETLEAPVEETVEEATVTLMYHLRKRSKRAPGLGCTTCERLGWESTATQTLQQICGCKIWISVPKHRRPGTFTCQLAGGALVKAASR